MSCLAFSANRSQFEAGSTTTGSICRPRTPPAALISSTAMSTTSRNDVSEIAMVPLRECRTPILTGSGSDVHPTNAAAPTSVARQSLRRGRRVSFNIKCPFIKEKVGELELELRANGELFGLGGADRKSV